MKRDAEDWKKAVVDYANQVNSAFTTWKTNISSTVSPAVHNLGKKVNAVVTASEKFTAALTGDKGLIN